MWITLLMALLTFFLSKKKGAGTGEAIAYSVLAGGATYAFTHSDMMKGTTLAALDGAGSVSAPNLSNDATNSSSVAGQVVPVVTTGGTSGLNPALERIAPSLVDLGTGAVLGAALSGSSMWFWLAVGLAAFLVLKE